MKHYLLIIIAISFTCSQLIAQRLPTTPKALDLQDHFGTEPDHNMYGPQVALPPQPYRVGLNSGVPLMPIENFHQEIYPPSVASGNLTNTAPDATKIIRVPYASPKAEIHTTFQVESVVNTPVHLGNKVVTETKRILDRVTGQVHETTKTDTKPILGVLKTVRPENIENVTVVDLRTNSLLNPSHPDKNRSFLK